MSNSMLFVQFLCPLLAIIEIFTKDLHLFSLHNMFRRMAPCSRGGFYWNPIWGRSFNLQNVHIGGHLGAHLSKMLSDRSKKSSSELNTIWVRGFFYENNRVLQILFVLSSLYLDARFVKWGKPTNDKAAVEGSGWSCIYSTPWTTSRPHVLVRTSAHAL